MAKAARATKRVKQTEAEKKALLERARIADSLSVNFSEMRLSAIRARQDIGLDRMLIEDEQFYEGYDSASRSQEALSGSPSTSKTAIEQGGPAGDREGRSTLFLNITRPFTDSITARVADMVIPTGDERAFTLDAAPIPDSDSIRKREIPHHIDKEVRRQSNGNEDWYKQKIEEIVASEDAVYQEHSERAKRILIQIDDWLVASEYNTHVRRCVDDAGRTGTGILKGPVPAIRKNRAFVDGRMISKEGSFPAFYRVKAQHCFPDIEGGGENVQLGSFHFERDYLPHHALRGLAGKPGVLDDQLAEVLREGPHQSIVPQSAEGGFAQAISSGELFGQRKAQSRFSPYELWYGYARISPQECADLEAMYEFEKAGYQPSDDPEDQDNPLAGEDIAVTFLLINNRLVRFARNPLTNGAFPYSYMPWQRIDGTPFGRGVPRQMRPAQKLVISAGRVLCDNMTLSAGFHGIIDLGMVYPLDGEYVMSSVKMWAVSEDSEVDDVRKALHFFEIPSRQAELQAIVEFGLKMAEITTSAPMILQGQMGGAPDTLGGMQMLNNNAAAPLRRFATLFDEDLTEPSMQRVLDYYQIHVADESESGNYVIDAQGSRNNVEREFLESRISTVLKLSENPVYGLDPKKVAKEFIASLRFDARKYKFDDDQWKEIVTALAAQAQQGPGSGQAEVWKMRLQHEATENQKDRDLKQASLAMELQAQQHEAEMRQAAIAVEMDLKAAEAQSFDRDSQAKIKASFAELMMKLQTMMRMKEMAAGSGGSNQTVTAPVEPEGRAAAGEAFQA